MIENSGSYSARVSFNVDIVSSVKTVVGSFEWKLNHRSRRKLLHKFQSESIATVTNTRKLGTF